MSDNKTARIRELNDAFRKELPGAGGRLMITDGVNGGGVYCVTKALAKVMAFDDFNVDNDPHQEHDFGSFEIDGQKLFCKRPGNPALSAGVTTRICCLEGLCLPILIAVPA
jgi:hypothetical protein